jgi:hypothetical protein
LTAHARRRTIEKRDFPMATTATNPKQQAHELIDRLSTGQASAGPMLHRAAQRSHCIRF